MIQLPERCNSRAKIYALKKQKARISPRPKFPIFNFAISIFFLNKQLLFLLRRTFLAVRLRSGPARSQQIQPNLNSLHQRRGLLHRLPKTLLELHPACPRARYTMCAASLTIVEIFGCVSSSKICTRVRMGPARAFKSVTVFSIFCMVRRVVKYSAVKIDTCNISAIATTTRTQFCMSAPSSRPRNEICRTAAQQQLDYDFDASRR